MFSFVYFLLQICVSACPNYTAAPLTSVALSIADATPLDISLIDWSGFICDYNFDPQTEYSLSDGDYVSIFWDFSMSSSLNVLLVIFALCIGQNFEMFTTVFSFLTFL